MIPTCLEGRRIFTYSIDSSAWRLVLGAEDQAALLFQDLLEWLRLTADKYPSQDGRTDGQTDGGG